MLHVFYIFVHFNQKVFAFLKATRGFIVSVIIGPVTVLGGREGDRQIETERQQGVNKPASSALHWPGN